jgi:hypothetical protein
MIAAAGAIVVCFSFDVLVLRENAIDWFQKVFAKELG